MDVSAASRASASRWRRGGCRCGRRCFPTPIVAGRRRGRGHRGRPAAALARDPPLPLGAAAPPRVGNSR